MPFPRHLRRGLRRLLRWFGRVGVALLMVVLVYGLLVVAGVLIPVNRGFVPPTDGVRIWLDSTPVHAELLLPVDELTPAEFGRLGIQEPELRGVRWVEVGWGDRRFFLETPTWDDLRLSVALQALFWPSPSVVHVRLHYFVPSSAVPIDVPRVGFQRLKAYLWSALRTDPSGRAIPVPTPYEGDRFYESSQHYHLFRTCNEWTNGALKAAGVRTALWTPFAWGVRWRFQQ